MPPLCRVFLFALGSLLVPVAPLHAQEPSDREASPDEEAPLTPPRLVEFVEADLPEEAPDAEDQVAVEMDLTIDREGRVNDVEVVESTNPVFDESAIEAARQFVFEPARRGETPIPSVIRYRYVFETRPPPEEPAPSDEPQRGVLAGRVLAMGSGEPLADATVSILSEDGNVTRRARTDAEGAFRFADLPPGVYRVRVEGEGLDPIDEREDVRSGEETLLTYRLDAAEAAAESAAPAEATFSAQAVVERPPREVTRRTIGKEELTRIPGTRGDALRAVELLPGVARPPFSAGLLIIRGSSPGDSEVFFDGTTVPLLYHFGGLTSFVNSRLLEQIDFYPGNFSARYGRKVGGILEVKSRDPATDEFHGLLDLNVLDVSALAEGPVGEDASVAVALRRSHIDFLFNEIVPAGAFDVVAAPVYWDYQAFAAWRPTSRDRFFFKLFGSSDRFEVILGEANETDPDIRGGVDLSTQFHYAQAGWERKLSDDVDQDLQLRVGPTLARFGVGDDIRFEGDFLDVYGRGEWRARLNDRVRLIWGVDVLYVPFDIRFRGPPPRQGEGTPNDPLSTSDNITANVTGAAFQPGFYLESDMRPWEPLRVVLGMRVDYFAEIDEFVFDPRLVSIYSLNDDWRLKAGVGIYSQPPDFQESAEEVGNPDLEPFHALHVSAGFEHDFTDQIELGVEGFYKHLWDRVIETQGGLPPGFENGGLGRIYGVEVLGRMTPGGDIPMFGYVSYTLSRSERRDRPGDRWRLFDFDQTHIFTMAAVYKLPKNWEVGATLRLVSGNPRTPIIGSLYDSNALVYRPVFGRVNSERNPLFNRLDFRVEKKWVFDAWKLAVYLDVQNLYNADNPEGRIHNFDFSRSEPVRGLPLLPSLGVRGEM